MLGHMIAEHGEISQVQFNLLHQIPQVSHLYRKPQGDRYLPTITIADRFLSDALSSGSI